MHSHIIIIDNDTSDSNYYNVRNSFAIYVSGSTQYNGDSRRAYSSSRDRYSWMWNNAIYNSGPYKNISITFGVYLNNYLFTDEKSAYYIEQKDGGYIAYNINQNTAKTGWNYFDCVINKNYATPGTFSVIGASVQASGTGSGFTGADAISLEIYN